MTPAQSMSAADNQALFTERQALMAQLAQSLDYDVAVIGGGATGLGVALDAALRGLKVVLVESHDFAKGTSSRATKLVHGGVRYLAQGNLSLVREALHERSLLLSNAAHLAQPLAFVMPSYSWWETPFYGLGLKAYDALAGKYGLGSTQFLSRTRTRQCLPGVNAANLTGGVKYWDGQFDDARLAVALARSAARAGALVLNYCEATGFVYANDRIVGLRCRDVETGNSIEIKARCVVNATGVWVDALRQMDQPQIGKPPEPMVSPSQGVHLVVDQDFFPGTHALLVPKTADGRVLFAVPWLGKVILGTTDTPRHDIVREPMAFKHEVDFILNESAKYLKRAPTRDDVKSIWVGLRPLVKPAQEEGAQTQSLSREHTVLISASGLVTVTGGKWTTYRAMAEDVLSQCTSAGLLNTLPTSRTTHHALLGSVAARDLSTRTPVSLSAEPGPHLYGSEQSLLASLPGADHWLLPGLSEAMVRFAVRYEYARTVEDMLARRSRLLFLDAKAAAAVAPEVAQIMQAELGRDCALAAFLALADQYAAVP